MKESYKILLRPILTEKMDNLKDAVNQYAFEVDRGANKIEIKQAVEQRFNVKVEKVRTMIVRGKYRRLGRFQGKRANWKKAIVTLRQGDTIDYVAGV
ncbi:50S ribosomal protein L23 [candidate division KSB1 bacterium]|nr:50S ribosomal protein L23 [bacterium]OQX59228.1 MAG: 50S ribosomal protein L23 [candidate division KSB1 bacterium 4484_219]RKY79639.1 MAG: 50S ribosomal protein L23 [candidate division KSB1 bacterium]HDI52460.1 50S ribosomal protein L23 [Bacteroidota bacterium]RKY80323.1 MAG: 50S ribosomal protein L23 [candidate division KSB1 bacterium]